MVTTAQRVLAGLARVKERGISLGLRPLEDSDAARVDPVGRSRRSLAPASFRRDLTTQPPATIFRTSSAVFGVTETDKLLNRRELCLGRAARRRHDNRSAVKYIRSCRGRGFSQRGTNGENPR